MKKQSLVRQTAILSTANTLVRAVGFVMRIWLSRMLGAEAMGIMELASSAHMLWIAPVTSGIPMAVSREAAAGHGASALRAGRKLALRISLFMTPVLLLASPWIARILGDVRTLPALLLYLPCLPVLGISAAYNGYCYGAGNTVPPSIAEIVEQGVRFFACALVLLLVPGMTTAWNAAVPPMATLAGELTSVVLIGWMLKKSGITPRGRAEKPLVKKIWKLSAPMTWMRVTSTMMRTVNSVLVPVQLRVSGLSAQEATARLGMFSGMAMPLVMLPSVVTGAIAMVSGPALARREHDRRAMRRIVLRVLLASLLVSMLAAAALAALAPWIAHSLYRQPDLQKLTRVLLPLIPLMGMQQVTGGMLAGLGKQSSALVPSLVGAMITLILNCALTPSYRLTGCALSAIAGQAMSLLMNLRILVRAVRREDT